MLIRAHVTQNAKTRLEATLPFRTLEMQLQFSLHAGLFTIGGMLPSAKAHAYARPILLYALSITLLRHAQNASDTLGRGIDYIKIPSVEVWHAPYCIYPRYEGMQGMG